MFKILSNQSFLGIQVCFYWRCEGNKHSHHGMDSPCIYWIHHSWSSQARCGEHQTRTYILRKSCAKAPSLVSQYTNILLIFIHNICFLFNLLSENFLHRKGTVPGIERSKGLTHVCPWAPPASHRPRLL